MFGRSITLFKMFGFAVRVDASWLIIAVLITWSFADSVFPHAFPGLSTAEYWMMGISGAFCSLPQSSFTNLRIRWWRGGAACP